jgi:UDP:flavonoid glycosyltransferase YjiC (YdhE family)
VKERQSIPVGLIGSATYLWPLIGGTFEQSKSDSHKRKAWRFDGMVKTYKEARRLLRLGDSAEASEGNPLLGDLFMIRSVRELESNVGLMPEEVRLIGACLWEPEQVDPELDEWLNNAQSARIPILYVQQGRFFQFPHFWPELMRVASELGVRVAASTGSMDCDVGEPPPDSFVRPYVPQGHVFRRADAAVLSANATAALGTLTAGVPALLIPAGGEQPDIAELCESAGSARLLDPASATVDTLRSELQIVLTDLRLKRAAGNLAAAFSSVNSAKIAADLLEDAASKRPALSFSRDISVRAGLAT